MLLPSCIASGCFHSAVAGLRSFDRDHMAWKASNIYSLSPLQKTFAEPWLSGNRGSCCWGARAPSSLLFPPLPSVIKHLLV